jgi:hypothetical protein
MEQAVAVDRAGRRTRWIEEILDPQVAKEHVGVQNTQRGQVGE